MADDDRRSLMSLAVDGATKASMLGLEFAVPVFLGHYLDVRLGTNPLFLMVGMVLGFVLGMVHILRIAREGSKPN
jgi:ATP synthase protein I